MVQVESGRIKKEGQAERDGEPAIAVVRRLAGLSQNKAKKLFSSGKVYVDSTLCLDWFRPLVAGAVVDIDTNRRSPGRMPAFTAANIVHLDSLFVIVDKPANLVSVPPTKTGEPTVLDLLTAVLSETRERPRPVPLHRLDRETSGLMLFGLKREEPAPRGDNPLSGLRDQLSGHQIERAYYAVVEGSMKSCTLEGVIDVTRTRWGGRQQHKFARTIIEEVERGRHASLVICRPKTGRWHQLRIQLSKAGHPIVGEREHLPEGRTSQISSRRLALQSFRIAFSHPETGEDVQWEKPLDPHLKRILEREQEEE